MDIIIQTLEETAGTPGLLLMRQVSKSWPAAVGGSPRAARCHNHRNAVLAHLCKILPCMASLEAQCDSLGYFKLNPLAQLTQLTRLSMTGRTPFARPHDYTGDMIEPLIELNHLPAPTKVLEVHSLYADPDCFGGITCTGLTRLSFRWNQNMDRDVAKLLECLLQLKVLVQMAGPSFIISQGLDDVLALLVFHLLFPS